MANTHLIALHNERLGQTKLNLRLKKMTIVEYTNAHDIKVQFEDGTIVHTDWAKFDKGVVQHPDDYHKRSEWLKRQIERTGQTNTAKNGLKMTIIDYHDSADVDIQFEDGAIVKHQRYRMFQEGKIKHPTIKPTAHQPNVARIGETHLSKTGRNMTIIAYRHKNDIDVQFDDGYITHHKRYINFKNGAVLHPNDKQFRHEQQEKRFIGLTKTKNDGSIMTIVGYRTTKDIDILFDDGTLVQHCPLNDFNRGFIRNPNATRNKHIGETNIAKNGLKIEIIDYKDSQNITVKFEDGFIRTTDYKSFTEGGIKHPDIDVKTQRAKNQYLNKTFTAINGMKFTVVEYKSSKHVIVQFEDGTQVKTTSGGIRSRHILNPNYTIQIKREGETNISSNGMIITLKRYATANDCDVLFEDGYLATNRTYGSFKKGHIEHPFPYQMNSITLDKPAYVTQGEGNFYCHCNKCGLVDIMSVNEMKNHKCETIVKPTV